MYFNEADYTEEILCAEDDGAFTRAVNYNTSKFWVLLRKQTIGQDKNQALLME